MDFLIVYTFSILNSKDSKKALDFNIGFCYLLMLYVKLVGMLEFRLTKKYEQSILRKILWLDTMQ